MEKYVGQLFEYHDNYFNPEIIRVFNVMDGVVYFDYLEGSREREISLDFFEQFLQNGYIKRKDLKK